MFLLFFCLLQDPNWDLHTVMQDPVWLGSLPNGLGESPVGVILSSNAELDTPPKYWVWQAGQFAEVKIEDLTLSQTGSSYETSIGTVWNLRGDIFLNKKPVLTGDDSYRIVQQRGDLEFVLLKDNQLFIFDLGAGSLKQISKIAFRDAPKDEEGWAYHEEPELVEYIDHRLSREKERENRSKQRTERDPLADPQTMYVGSGFNIARSGFISDRAFFLHPSDDLTKLVVVLEPEKDGSPTQYAQFINEDAKVKALDARPKVGHEGKSWKAGIGDIRSGIFELIDFSGLPGIDEDPLAEIKKTFSEEDQKRLKEFSGPRAIQVFPGGFRNGTHQLLLTVIAQDFKDRWICIYDVAQKELKVLHQHHDPAWVQLYFRQAGEGDGVSGRAFWVDQDHIAFLSDEEGYQNLFEYDLKKEKLSNLTKGEFEIFSPYLSDDKSTWYFHSNKTHPGEMHFYSMDRKGKDWKQFTSGEGQHSVLRIKNGELFSIFGRATRPPEVLHFDGSDWNTVYQATSDAYQSMPKVEPQFITYKARDGKTVHARLYKPENPNGAGVVFVHGAGYLQNAHKGWSGYFREFMFHQMLVQQGFTVLDPDYRASAGYGREWRTAIYRHMGGHDLNDVVDGAGYLVREHGVDERRVGVYGGSYGGFITLMAMFNAPQTFQAGIALRPVTDWAYYNHWYTSRILNTPQEDPVAYRQSSPIYFAEGLQGRLIMCHGMVDDNVQFQDSVRLAQRLIELKKHGWELASYPVEPHGFRMPSSWYDEYRRIYELFQETLLD